jgi:hypothetical protein
MVLIVITIETDMVEFIFLGTVELLPLHEAERKAYALELSGYLVIRQQSTLRTVIEVYAEN